MKSHHYFRIFIFTTLLVQYHLFCEGQDTLKTESSAGFELPDSTSSTTHKLGKNTYFLSLNIFKTGLFGPENINGNSLRTIVYRNSLTERTGGELGFTCDLPLNQRLGLETGLKMGFRGFQLFFNTGDTITYYSDGILDSMYINSVKYNRKWNDYYFSVPLRFRLNMYQNKWLRLSIQMGTGIDIIWLTKHRMYYTNDNWRSLDVNRSSQYAIDIPTGIGIRAEFSVDEGGGYAIEPQINMTLTNRLEEFGWKPRYLFYGVKLSFFIRTN